MTKNLHLRRATTLGLAASVIAGVATVAPSATAAPALTRAALPHSAPLWLSRAVHVAPASRSAAQSLRVYLAPRGGLDDLKAAVAAVSTPGSAEYRHYLSAADYYSRYAPTADAVSAVDAWLGGAGLSVTGVDDHRRFVDVTGSTAAAEAAFGVSLQTYRHDGQTVQAPSGAVSVPAALAAEVLGVTGLDTTQQISTVQAAPPPVFANARPCSMAYGTLPATYEADYRTRLPKFDGRTLPYAVCGYTGPQFRAAYEGGSPLTGAGVTVGIIDAYAAPTITQDAGRYASTHGDGAYAKGQYTQTIPKKFNHQTLCGPSGWYGEQTLDVESVHAMAPGANIHFYGAASCLNNDLLTAARAAVDADQVKLVSNSYGDTEANATTDYIVASEQVFMQGAMEGISFLFSSGDNGDELAATGIKQADYQASDPYVTAVGGTSTAIDGTGQIALQTGWGTEKYTLSSDGKQWSPVGFVYGSGGGYSGLFDRPAYQSKVVPADAPTGRAVPDVAMDADPTTGMLIGETQTYPDGSVHYGEYRIGGTSLASPLFAGMTALTEQHAGEALGFLNPLIYGHAGSAFTDVVPVPGAIGDVRPDFANLFDASGGIHYSVRTLGQDSSLAVTKGWDDVTGVGTPSPKWLTIAAPAATAGQ